MVKIKCNKNYYNYIIKLNKDTMFSVKVSLKAMSYLYLREPFLVVLAISIKKIVDWLRYKNNLI